MESAKEKTKKLPSNLEEKRNRVVLGVDKVSNVGR